MSQRNILLWYVSYWVEGSAHTILSVSIRYHIVSYDQYRYVLAVVRERVGCEEKRGISCLVRSLKGAAKQGQTAAPGMDKASAGLCMEALAACNSSTTTSIPGTLGIWRCVALPIFAFS